MAHPVGTGPGTGTVEVKPAETAKRKAREPLGETEEQRKERYRLEGRAPDGTVVRAVSSTDAHPDDFVRREQNRSETLSEASNSEFSSSDKLIGPGGVIGQVPPNGNYDLIGTQQMRAQLRNEYIAADAKWKTESIRGGPDAMYQVLPSADALQALRNMRGAYQEIPKPYLNGEVRGAADLAFGFADEALSQDKIARQSGDDTVKQKTARDAARQAATNADAQAAIAENKALNGSNLDVQLAKDARLVANGATRAAAHMDIAIERAAAERTWFRGTDGKLEVVPVLGAAAIGLGAAGMLASVTTLLVLYGTGKLYASSASTAGNVVSGNPTGNPTGLPASNLEIDVLNTVAKVEVDLVAENAMTAYAQYISGVQLVDTTKNPPANLSSLPAKDSSGNKIGSWNGASSTHIVYTADAGKTGVNPLPVSYALDLSSQATAKTTNPATLTVAFFPPSGNIAIVAGDTMAVVTFSSLPVGFALVNSNAGWVFDHTKNEVTFTPLKQAAGTVVQTAYTAGQMSPANMGNLIVLFPGDASNTTQTIPKASRTGPTIFTIPPMSPGLWTLTDGKTTALGSPVVKASGQAEIGDWNLDTSFNPNTITFTPAMAMDQSTVQESVSYGLSVTSGTTTVVKTVGTLTVVFA